MDDDHSPAVLHRYGPGDVPALLDTLVEIWADAHADHPDVAEASLSPEALRQQLTTHTRHQGFALVLAFAAGDPVGFVYGFGCEPAYWFGPELRRLSGVVKSSVQVDANMMDSGT